VGLAGSFFSYGISHEKTLRQNPCIPKFNIRASFSRQLSMVLSMKSNRSIDFQPLNQPASPVMCLCTQHMLLLIGKYLKISVLVRNGDRLCGVVVFQQNPRSSFNFCKLELGLVFYTAYVLEELQLK